MGGVEAEQTRAAKVQDALYRIAELASAAQDMQEFYRAIHEVVGELMYANNLFIALYDEERRRISWPYWVDEVDVDWPDTNVWVEFGSREARGMTAFDMGGAGDYKRKYGPRESSVPTFSRSRWRAISRLRDVAKSAAKHRQRLAGRVRVHDRG